MKVVCRQIGEPNKPKAEPPESIVFERCYGTFPQIAGYDAIVTPHSTDDGDWITVTYVKSKKRRAKKPMEKK